MHEHTEDLASWARQWRPALQAFGIDPATVTARLISYSENATYLCTQVAAPGTQIPSPAWQGAQPTPDTPDVPGAQVTPTRWVLRLHRPSFRSIPEVRSELAWIAALRSAGAVGTPGFRLTPDADPVAVFAGADGLLQHAVLFDHVEGHEPDEASFTSVMRTVGAQTAALHQHALAWRPPSSFARPVWDVDHLIGQHSLWGQWRSTPEVHTTPHAEQLLAGAERQVRRALEQFGSEHDRFGLIHGDLRSTNLLVQSADAGPGTGPGGATAGTGINIIDFDDCGMGWYMYDLACSLSFVEHSPDVPRWVQAWLAGYRSRSVLSDDDVAIIPTMIMLRRLLLVAWLESRRDSPYASEIRDEYVAQSVGVARRYLTGTLLTGGAPTQARPSSAGAGAGDQGRSAAA